jgi:tetratricopeptide (TPR) repeat protein
VCRGRVERSRGDFPAAAAALERAFWLASDHGAMDVAAGAAAQSALVAVSAGRIADAHDWVRHGEAAVARASPDVAPIAADLEIAQASAALTQGHHAEALPHYERALEIRTRTWGEESRGAATALKLVANCLQRMERIDEALPKHDLAIERLETALGRDHVDLAAAINDRATSYQSMGRFEDALVDLRRALEMTERLGLSTHPNAGMIRHNMGYSLRRLGRRQEALQQYRRALEIRRAAHGPDHEKTLKTANNLGQVLCELGQVDEGEAVLLDALARYEAQPPHRLQGSVLANLVRVAELRSDAAAAAVYRRRHAALLAEVGEGAER